MKTIGIIGGGQLGLMIAQQAHGVGARTICLDPDGDAPAFGLCDEHIVAAFDDAQKLEELCQRSDVVTYEFENIPGEVLIPLEKKYNIPQGFRPLFDSQDRLREKNNAIANGLKTPRFFEVNGIEQLANGVAELGFPCVLKTRTLGYDGHGQMVIHDQEELKKADKMLSVPLILEEFIEFDYETSIVMINDGQRVIHFPVGQNIHKNGILDLCLIPAPRMSEQVRKKIEDQSREFIGRCGYLGILAIEYFVKGDQIYFNEMAPRPHNSGHYTIEGCTTNQFRELCRFLLGEPLHEPKLLATTVMKNILGHDMQSMEMIKRENLPGVYPHIYGKKVNKPERKMGHITIVGLTKSEYDLNWKHRFRG